MNTRPIGYDEFTVRISGREGIFTVEANSSEGEASAPFELPWRESDLRQCLRIVERSRGVSSLGYPADAVVKESISEETVRGLGFGELKPAGTIEKFGRELFQALLPKDLLSLYRTCRNKVNEDDRRGLRMRLDVDVAELATLPWEYLYDEAEGKYVNLSVWTPITRYVKRGQPQPKLTTKLPLKILGMISSPLDLPQLDVEKERERMTTAVEHVVKSGLISLTWIPGQTWSDLQEWMSKDAWHVFHFIGHGGFDERRQEGLIELADEHGNARHMSASDLGMFLADQKSLRLAVLNSCEGGRASKENVFSSSAATLMRCGIPAVVSMQYEITDLAALEFSRAFYDALAEGSAVDAAVQKARKAIRMSSQDSLEWGTPVLHMRSTDGALFRIDMAATVYSGVAPTIPVVKPASSMRPRPTDLKFLLQRVKEYWMDGVLHKSIERDRLMTPEVEFIEDAAGHTQSARPAGDELSTFFAGDGASLLILGDPGVGKTTVLLALARDLIVRAEEDVSRAVPVVLSLANWKALDPRYGTAAAPGQKFSRWATEQIRSMFKVPADQVEAWMQDNLLLLLMDGLDEVSEDSREDCVNAINSFAPRQGSAGIAVCSRLKEYLELEQKLSLTAAVRLKALSREAVFNYVAAAGPRLDALRIALEENSSLQILARSPLMLGLMVQVYRNRQADEGSGGSLQVSSGELREEIMSAYVRQMFRRAAEGTKV